MSRVCKLKLTIELVPETLWHKSLYRLLPPDEWRKLKEEVFAREGYRCYICGSTSPPLELHEFWSYDDRRHIQKLVGVHHLCRLCHMVKHIGFHCHTRDGREKLKRLGLSHKSLIRHFCAVNGCSEEEFYKHKREAFRVWGIRSQHAWKQDWGEYNKYLGRKSG